MDKLEIALGFIALGLTSYWLVARFNKTKW